MARWPKIDIKERFMQYVSPEPMSGCWLWTGAAANDADYGAFSVKNRAEKAHRVAYTLFVGPPPAGMDLDHLCSVPACVNPQHLEPVTHRVNMRRGKRNMCGVNARKTACPRGHPYDIVRRRKNGSLGRECRRCVDAQTAAGHARTKARKAGVLSAL